MHPPFDEHALISDAYSCRENRKLLRTKMCLFCMLYLYSRQTFCGETAIHWWQRTVCRHVLILSVSARKPVQSCARCQFSERMSSVASTGHGVAVGCASRS